MEDYDTFIKRINERKSSMAAKIEKETISDVKNVFCKYCNEAFYTQRAVDVHIMTLHAEEGERETKRAKRRKEMGMDKDKGLNYLSKSPVRGYLWSSIDFN